MAVYAMPVSSPYRRPFRWLAISAVSFLLAALLFSIWTPTNVTDRVTTIVGLLCGAIVLFSVFGASWLGMKENLWKENKDYCLELTDGKLVQRRPDRPMVEIPIDQITEIMDGRSWLFIEGGEPKKRIVVPTDVLGVKDLKRQLSSVRKISRFNPTMTFLLPLAVFMTACAFILFSQERIVILTSGSVAFVLGSLMVYNIYQRTKKIPRARLVTIGWVVTLLVLVWITLERAFLRP
jgi:hypothetical protein